MFWMRNIKATSLIIPTVAIRDEGASYHYQVASDEIEVNVDVLASFALFLVNHGRFYNPWR